MRIDLTKYTDFIVERAKELLSVDSPTGYTADAAKLVCERFRDLGYAPELTVKGGVLVKLSDGVTSEGGLLLEAHTDTLGGMVSQIKSDGRLELTRLGGMNANNARP